MELYLIGRILREFRIRRGLTQEDLADICSLATISRIENGNQVPSRRLVEALFHKMGFSSPSNEVLAKDIELQLCFIEQEMSKMCSEGNHEFKHLLEEYSNCAKEKNMNEFEKQVYLFYSAVYESEHNHKHEKVLEKLFEALNLTFPNYWQAQKSKERKILLTQNELLIISNIAIEKYAMKQCDEAISIMEDMKEYYENNFIDEEEREKHFAVVLLSLADWYDKKKDYQKALKLCDEGILHCSKASLPAFILNRGGILWSMDKKEEGIKTMKDGLRLFEYLQQDERLKKVRQEIKKVIGLDL